MIISHKHRFIFLHCPKAAGSSVSTSLYRYLGPRDVAIGCWSDALAEGIRLNRRSAIDVLRPPGIKSLTRAMIRLHQPGSAFNQALKDVYSNSFGIESWRVAHMTAWEMSKLFPEEWYEYTKLCIVRNPYERVASDYVWRTRPMTHPPTFAQYLMAMRRDEHIEGSLRLPFMSSPFYTLRGKVVVDFICKYENILPDLHTALSEIGLNWDGWLPSLKMARRSKPYKDLYGDLERTIVEELFSDELELFGYGFPP